MSLLFKEAFERKKEEEKELEDFRDEIDQVAAHEFLEKSPAHFEGTFFNSKELDLDDMYIWKKIKDETVTKSGFETYRDLFNQKTMTPSREAFMSLTANRATPIIFRRSRKKK